MWCINVLSLQDMLVLLWYKIGLAGCVGNAVIILDSCNSWQDMLHNRLREILAMLWYITEKSRTCWACCVTCM